MARWRIAVTPPKAKRMAKNGKLIIHFSHGWEGGYRKEHDLQDALVQWDNKSKELEVGDCNIFEFDIDDNYEYIYNTSVSDGDTFELVLEYTNSTNTRKETIKPVPERIK